MVTEQEAVRVHERQGSLTTFFDAAKLTPMAPGGRPGRAGGGAIGTFDPCHLEVIRRRLRRDVIVEHLRRGFRYMPVNDDADDEVLVARVGSGDSNAIAFVDHAIWLGALTVDFDLSTLAGALRSRSSGEKARDVKPNI